MVDTGDTDVGDPRAARRDLPGLAAAKNPLRWRLLSGSLALVALAISGFVLAN